jgi:hypothetical protein
MFLTLAWVLVVVVLALGGIASEVEDRRWPAYEHTGGSRFAQPGFFAYPPEMVYSRDGPVVPDGAEGVSPR